MSSTRVEEKPGERVSSEKEPNDATGSEPSLSVVDVRAARRVAVGRVRLPARSAIASSESDATYTTEMSGYLTRGLEEDAAPRAGAGTPPPDARTSASTASTYSADA